MVVNQSKTELMHMKPRHETNDELFTITCGDTRIVATHTMKVLGVLMDDRMTWSQHIASNINKMSRLSGALKFIRGRLSRDQFLTVLTSQYYGTCYYASQAWLGNHTKKSDIRKLNGTHYRLLRVAIRDWKNNVPRCELDKLGRAKPSLWGKYAVANCVIKIIRDQAPTRLRWHIEQTMYSERRHPNIVKFYDNSRLRIGRHAVGNRLKEIFDEINEPITFLETNCSLRQKLKRVLGFLLKNNTSITVAGKKSSHCRAKDRDAGKEDYTEVAIVWRDDNGALL
jgi:hypothetical protein